MLQKMKLFIAAWEGGEVTALLTVHPPSPHLLTQWGMGHIMKTFFHHFTVIAPNCNHVISCCNDKVHSNTEFHTEELLRNPYNSRMSKLKTAAQN